MSSSRSVHRAGALLAAILVVAWRVAAFRRPSSLVDQAPGVAPALTTLGLVFVALGLAVFWFRSGTTGRLFLAWCLCSGVHWGGAVGAASSTVELSLVLFYLGISVAGEAAFLDLALAFPPGWNRARRWRGLLYLPAVAGLALAPLAGALSTQLLRTVAAVLLLAGSLLGVCAGVVFIARWFRADGRTRLESRLGVVVICLLIGGVPSLLASFGILPGPADAYNLLSILPPAGLAYALARRRS